MKQVSILLLFLGLLLPGMACAQVVFTGAKVLSQRSATQGLASIDDEVGNRYMAIPFYDTLKLKNPDAIYAAPSHKGRTTGNYALALIKTNPAGERVGVQLMASSFNMAVSAYWKEARQGHLKLIVQTTGGLSAGAARAANGSNPSLAYSGGFVDLDTNLQVTRIWQTERDAIDTAWVYPMYSRLAGPNSSLQYVASVSTRDTVQVARQSINVTSLRATGLEEGFVYGYMAAVNTQQPTVPLAVSHIFWQPGLASNLSITAMTSDSVGNVYVSVDYQKTAGLMVDDSLVVAGFSSHVTMTMALCILKFSPTGRLLWARPFYNEYRVILHSMTPTPSGDKLFAGLEARGELMLGDSLVQTDFTGQGCGGVPGTALAVVLNELGQIENYSMFNNEPKSTAYISYIQAITLSPSGEVYWGGVASGFPKMFHQSPIQVWGTLYVTCTDRNLNFKWKQLVGGPNDGTTRSIDNMIFSPARRELMFVGHLEHYVSATAVGVGPMVLNTVCPAQFVATISSPLITGTLPPSPHGPLAVFPNPSQSGQTITVLSNDRSYRLVDALGRTISCTAALDHTLTLPAVAPGFYHLQGDQTGQKVRVVIER